MRKGGRKGGRNGRRKEQRREGNKGNFRTNSILTICISLVDKMGNFGVSA